MILRRKCTGAKHITEAAKFLKKLVGERSILRRRLTVRTAGVYGSENAGVSNEKTGENPVRRKPKVSRGRFVRPGLVGS